MNRGYMQVFLGGFKSYLLKNAFEFCIPLSNKYEFFNCQNSYVRQFLVQANLSKQHENFMKPKLVFYPLCDMFILKQELSVDNKAHLMGA